MSITIDRGPDSDPSLRAPASLSVVLWASAAPTYDAILVHPFLQRLGDGTLEADQFAYYLIQDGHYIRFYAQCLAMLAGRAPTRAGLDILAAHSAEAVKLEVTLHADLLQALEMSHLDPVGIPASPTTFAYANSLTASCAKDSFLEGLVAMLPCYWIYARVGHHLTGVQSPHEVFARWIDNYSGGLYEKSVCEVLDLVDELGRTAGPAELNRCVERYQRGAQYEWMFWDAAYKRETWPI